MTEDPIVAEVHRAREILAAECNYDLHAFFEGVRKRQLIRLQNSDSVEVDNSEDQSELSASFAPTA